MIIKNIKWAEIVDNESEIVKDSAFYIIPLEDNTCKIVVVDDIGVTREVSSGSSIFSDKYVTQATFSSSTGSLTLNRSAGLSPLSVNLDGRYLTSNQTITLSGDISGSGSNGINTVAQSTIITNKPISTTLDPESSFLYYDSNLDELSQLKWSSISTYIDTVISEIPPYNPPQQDAINVSGDGLNFIKDLKVDIYGKTILAELGTVQDADIAIKGVVSKPKPEDLLPNNTLDVTTPSDVYTIVQNETVLEYNDIFDI